MRKGGGVLTAPYDVPVDHEGNVDHQVYVVPLEELLSLGDPLGELLENM